MAMHRYLTLMTTSNIIKLISELTVDGTLDIFPALVNHTLIMHKSHLMQTK